MLQKQKKNHSFYLDWDEVVERARQMERIN